MQTHFLTTDLLHADGNSWGTGSRARFAVAPATDCLVFVHGFGGSATDTWLQFPRFLPMEPACASIDLLFYGYDGLHDTAAYSSEGFLKLLQSVNASPARDVVNPSLPEGAPPRGLGLRYKRVIICAHSLGAVVARLALLEAGRVGAGAEWLSRTSLILFAPAHKGARVLRLASLALRGISIPVSGRLIEAGFRFRWRVLDDLEIGCQLLQDLERQTERAFEARPNRSGHLRARVVHAKKDRVVVDQPFVQDHPTIRLTGKGHQSVCKPQLGDLRPMEQLLKWL